MHYCNVKSKQFDEVIYLSADDIELGKFQTYLKLNINLYYTSTTLLPTMFDILHQTKRKRQNWIFIWINWQKALRQKREIRMLL